MDLDCPEPKTPRCARWNMWLVVILVLSLVCAVSYLTVSVVVPKVLKALCWEKDRKAAVEHLRSLGLPVYPGMALTARLIRGRKQVDHELWFTSQAGFRTTDDLQTVVSWYRRTLSFPPWQVTRRSSMGVVKRWEATRQLGTTSLRIIVSTEENQPGAQVACLVSKADSQAP